MKRYIKASKTIEDYEAMGVFDDKQLREIRIGLEDGVDVSWYTDPKYDWEQMKVIRYGLQKGLDVSVYADPKYDYEQMHEIWSGLNMGVDVSWYADPKYARSQMRQILYGLFSGVDVSQYADPKYDWEQMLEIRKGLESGGAGKSKRINWKSLVNNLQREAEDGIDSLYKQTDAGSKLESIQQEVENALGIWLEPSVQAGRGGIWFRSSEDDSTLVSNYDYQTFNEDTVDMAIESKNKTEYKKRYKAYLENILEEYAVEE